jgi:hypothetical protein
MLQRHHIVPKHMGGTDDPSNITLLTRSEHAEAHRLLYVQHGKWQDYWAWKFLGRSKQWEWLKIHNPMKRPEVREKVSQTMKERHRLHPESIETRKRKRLVKLGSNNPSFGKHGFWASANTKSCCPHCGTEANQGNLRRWHLDKCPNQPELSV